MINFEEVTYSYLHQTPVFKDFSWQASRGEAWAVLGPSGCGKTTLLYLLAGLRFPASGRILIDDQLVTRPRPHTGLILQDYGLLPWSTVRQNVGLGFRIRSFYGPDGTHAPRNTVATRAINSAMVDHWLERLGISQQAHKYPAQLSGGQRQRAAIARTLALHPDLLLMDEPFSSLDAPTREGLQNLTLELQAENNLTLVIVTHAIEEAAFLGRKILLLGHPPIALARIIENPSAGQPGFRSSTEYLELCQDLRRRLENL